MGKRLVPGTEQRRRPIYFQRQSRPATAAELPLPGFVHHLTEVAGEQDVEACFDGRILEPRQGAGNDLAAAKGKTTSGPFEQLPRFGQFVAKLGAGRALDFDVARERAVAVDPRFHRELVTADPLRHDRGAPAVIVRQPHRLPRPVLALRAAPQ